MGKCHYEGCDCPAQDNGVCATHNTLDALRKRCAVSARALNRAFMALEETQECVPVTRKTCNYPGCFEYADDGALYCAECAKRVARLYR